MVVLIIFIIELFIFFFSHTQSTVSEAPQISVSQKPK